MKNNTTDNLVKAIKEATNELLQIQNYLEENDIMFGVGQIQELAKNMNESLTAYEQEQSGKVPLHKCKYCGAMTEQKDDVCWNNPDKLNEEQTEGKTRQEILNNLIGFIRAENSHEVQYADAIHAMQLYSDQQTAPLLKQIEELQELIREGNQFLHDLNIEHDEFSAKIEELSQKNLALNLLIDEITDGNCLKQTKAKLSAEIKEKDKQIEELTKENICMKALLESAANLVGNPATNISSSTDIACESWQLSYKHFIDQ